MGGALAPSPSPSITASRVEATSAVVSVGGKLSSSRYNVRLFGVGADHRHVASRGHGRVQESRESIRRSKEIADEGRTMSA